MPIEDPFEKDPLLHEHNVAAVAGGGSGGSITTAIRRHDNNRVDSSGMYSSHFGECTISWRYILVLILAGCNIFTFADLCLLSASVGPAGSDLSSPTARHSAFLAFYAGYIVAALPGGRAAETHGGKKNIIVGMLCWALANIALAVAFPYPTSPWIGVMVGARALQGLAQGIIFPATFHLISTWFPERERTVAMALTLGGLDVGAALGMMLMPTYLVTSGGDPFSSITRSATESGDAEDEGSTASSSLRSAGRIWQAHYYVFAIAGVMLSAAAYKLVSSTPEWHPRISLPEVQHITKDRPKPIGLLDLNQVAAIEWRTLVTHPALLAIYGTHTICCLVFHLALIYLPFLFAERFGIPLKYFVSYMILPSAASVGAAIAGGAICDALIQAGAPKRLVRTRTVAIGLGVPAAGLVLLRLAPSFHSAMAVATLGAACAGLGPKAGWLANILDVAPNHAGLIAGFTTMVSAIPAIIAANATSTQLQIELLEGQLGGWMITVAGSILLIAAAVIFNLGCGDEAILR